MENYTKSDSHEIIRPNRSVWVLPLGQVVDVEEEGVSDDGSAFSHGIYVKNWVRFRLDGFHPDKNEVAMASSIRARALELIREDPNLAQDTDEEGFENPYSGDLAFNQAAEEQGWVRIKPLTKPLSDVILAETYSGDMSVDARTVIQGAASRQRCRLSILTGGALQNRAVEVLSDYDEDWQTDAQEELLEAIGGAPEIQPPGWLTPEGAFFPSQPTPNGRIVGMELGGHEAAAVDWLPNNRPELLELLERELEENGFECYLNSDGTDMIKKFMFRHGFVRLGPLDGEMEIEGDPSVDQKRIAGETAAQHGQEPIYLRRKG